MIGYLKSIRKFPLKLIPLAVCATILAAALSIYITIYESNRVDSINAELHASQENVEWGVIENLIKDTYDQAKKDSKITAMEVEHGLTQNYPDLGVLKEQFSKEEYTKKFNDILKDTIQIGDHYKPSMLTIVGTRNHLITMFANNDSHILGNVNSDTVVGWDEIAELTPHPNLTRKSIQSILNKENGVIFTFSEEIDNDFVQTVKKPNISILEEIYKLYGVEGLNSVTLLAAAYITESGDIFGTDDRTMLSSNENHKLIIVKSVRLGDILEEDEHRMENIMTPIHDLNDMAQSQGERLLLQSIMWSCILFLLSLFLIVVYNSEEKKGHLNGDGKGGK